MIYVGNVKQRLMDILIKSGKPVNKARTVPVKVWVTSDPNRPQGYWTTVYKNPDEVADDDKVITNHSLLPKTHPQYKRPATRKKAIPKDVKKRVDDFVDSTFGNDRAKVYDFLIKNNITWNRCLTAKTKDGDPNTAKIKSQAIDYMRAKMALKEAVYFQGFKLSNPQPIGVVHTLKPSTPKAPMVSGTPTIVLPPKAKKVSMESKDKMRAFYATFDSNQDFLDALDKMGLERAKNKKNDKDIELMRAKEALSKYIENGFDPFNPTGETVPVSAPTVEVDPSALQVPDNATPRQKAIIEHINKMTDIEAIEACSRVGVVPEDIRAQDFVVSKLQANLVNTLSKASAQVKQRIDQEWGKGVLSRLQAWFQNDTNDGKPNTPEGFGKQMSEITNIVGCKKNVVQDGFQLLASSFNMAVLTNPRDTLSTPVQNGSMGQNGGTQISTIIQALNEGYSNHTTDNHAGFQSNLGYAGYDPDTYASRFKFDQGNHDGFCLYLDKIASDNPTIKEDTIGLKQKYKELMSTCDGNPNLLNAVLSSTTWSNVPDTEYKPSTFAKMPLTDRPQAVAAVNLMDKTYGVVVGELKRRGYSTNDIYSALQDTVHNDNLEEFHIGNDVINFREVKAPNNKPFLKKADCAWGTGSLACALARFHGETQGDSMLEHTNPPEGCAEAWGYYKAAKQIADFAPDKYIEAHKLSHELFGLSMTKNKQPLDYSTIDTNKPWKAQGITQSTDSPISNTIVTNLIMGQLHHSINTAIAQNITKNAHGRFNNSGIDYAGNFDYYSGTVMAPQSEKRFTQLGNNPGNGSIYTAQQLSDKITAQIKAVPNYSEDYIAKVKNFYASKDKAPMSESFAKFYNKGMEPILESPIKDVLYKVTQDIASNTPYMASKPKSATQMAKNLDYVPFDFDHAGKQPRYNKPKTNPEPPPIDRKALLSARQKLFEAATCSLKTEDKATSSELQAQMSGPGFDYKDSNSLAMGEKDETNPNMNAPRRPLHSGSGVNAEHNRVLIFNSPFFQINNSIDEEEFNENHDRLTYNGTETLASKPLDLYQGLTYSAAAGMLKQDEDITIDTDSALGRGQHYSYKAGHAAGFVGDQHVRASKVGAAVAARSPFSGIMGMAKVMRGSATSNQGSSALKQKLTSLSGDHRSNPPLPDYELCVKAKGLAYTHHIVDVTVMNIGLTAQRTDTGIVKATTKELIADSAGTSINMAYKEDF